MYNESNLYIIAILRLLTTSAGCYADRLEEVKMYDCFVWYLEALGCHTDSSLTSACFHAECMYEAVVITILGH